MIFKLKFSVLFLLTAKGLVFSAYAWGTGSAGGYCARCFDLSTNEYLESYSAYGSGNNATVTREGITFTCLYNDGRIRISTTKKISGSKVNANSAPVDFSMNAGGSETIARTYAYIINDY